jgi:hypothetical protein
MDEWLSTAWIEVSCYTRRMGRRSTSLLGLAVLSLACGPTVSEDADLVENEVCLEEGRFASRVLSYDPSHSGAPAPTNPSYRDPEAALGPPDYDFVTEQGAVALGSGGLLEVEFTGCALGFGGEGTPDLRVYEVGPFYERTFLSVRVARGARGIAAQVLDLADDGYIAVGSVEGGVTDVDLDERLPDLASLEGFAFDAIRILDDPEQGGWGPGEATGADIDSVEILTGRD